MVGVYIYFKGLIRIMWSVSAGRWGSGEGVGGGEGRGTIGRFVAALWKVTEGAPGACPPLLPPRAGTKQSVCGLNKPQAVCLRLQAPSVRPSVTRDLLER